MACIDDDFDHQSLGGLPEDEYDSYLREAFAMVKNRARNFEVARYLGSIEHDHMGLTMPSGNKGKFVRELIRYAEYIGVRPPSAGIARVTEPLLNALRVPTKHKKPIFDERAVVGKVDNRLTQWRSGNTTEISRAVCRELARQSRPRWVADILWNFSSGVPNSMLSQLIEIAEDDSRWRDAEALFHAMRRVTLSIEPNQSQDKSAYLFSLMLECGAKVVRNSADTNPPFDPGACAWFIQILSGVVQCDEWVGVQDQVYRDVVRPILVN